ncbi:hypothetical protein AACH06_28435 [Ideonella sp. DXS29W]|uniref:Circularly permuted ATPgrasp domain-containing protein n=1 Tax=Ideonella lacteola TaxID=2984193 RepID=A0ABU9BXQ1_9BURK
MKLHPNYLHSWEDYLRERGSDVLSERDVFQRRLYRLKRTILFPPPLFDKRAVDELAEAAVELVKIVGSIPERIFGGDHRAWMRFLAMPQADVEFLAPLCRPRLMARATEFARPDFLPTDSGPRVTEINISTPIGGMATCEPYVDEFANTGFARHLAKQGACFDTPATSELWLNALMAQCPLARVTEAPIMFEALANPDDRDASRQAFVNLAARAGFNVISGLLTEITVKADGVFVYGQRIHTVYTMFTWNELKRFVPYSLVQALVAAEEDGLVDFIGAPVTALFDHKANLELLTSPAFAHRYTEAEQSLLKRVVPLTFRVTQESVEHALDRRVDLVLKPGDEYGGNGVVFGSSVSPEEWERRLREANASCQLYVCQAVVRSDWRHDVAMPGGRRRYVACLGPMVFGGVYAGLAVRQTVQGGDTPVINVANGAEEGCGLSVW